MLTWTGFRMADFSEQHAMPIWNMFQNGTYFSPGWGIGWSLCKVGARLHKGTLEFCVMRHPTIMTMGRPWYGSAWWWWREWERIILDFIMNYWYFLSSLEALRAGVGMAEYTVVNRQKNKNKNKKTKQAHELSFTPKFNTTCNSYRNTWSDLRVESLFVKTDRDCHVWCKF